MDLGDKEIVQELDKNAKKASGQILESDIKPNDRVTSAASLGLKGSSKYKIGGVTAIDLKDTGYWETLGDNEDARIKSFKGDAVPLLRWISSVGNPDWNAWNKNGKKGPPPQKDNEWTTFYLQMVNEVVNVGYFDLYDHPKLQYLLFCCVGSGEKQNHGWINMPPRRRRSDKIDDLLLIKFPDAKPAELRFLKSTCTIDDIEQLAMDAGYDDKAIKEVVTEFTKARE